MFGEEEDMVASSIVRGLRDLSTLTRTVAGKELRDEIVLHARRFFRVDAVAMWRLESRERLWRIAATTGLSADYSSFAIEAPSDGNVANILPGPLLVADARAWPLVDARRALYDTEGIASFLVLPLTIRGETAGTITCYYRTPKPEATQAEIDAATVFGQIASTALSTERYDQLADVAREVAGRLDLDAVVQRITDAATTLTGAQFGAFFYNVIRADGEAYTLYTISGVPREHFSKFPMPRNTQVFAPTLPVRASCAVGTSSKIRGTGRTPRITACPPAISRW
jgi:GAF domain-containing protein